MGTAQQPLALLLLGLCLLYLPPNSVEAACCTFGQPTYRNAEISATWLTITTCSDGPCKGPGFDYFPANAVESRQSDSCCDTGPGDPVNGFYYNPQNGFTYTNGSLALWYPAATQFNLTFPGTGKTCDKQKPRTRCNMGGEVVPTCQDTNITAQGPQQFVCPPNWVFDNASVSVILTPEECCIQLRPRLALISSFPPGYNGQSANLRADESNDKDSCVKPLSPKLNVNNVTVLQPGPGQCAGANNSGFMVPGSYDLDEGNPPTGTTFIGWQCYNTTSGTQGPPLPLTDLSVDVTGNSSITCVASFAVMAPPKLALISQFPAEYKGPTANLSAVASAISSVCVKPFSPRLDLNNVTVTQPGPGNCGNGDGIVPPGVYTLSQSAPKGTEFDRWDCWDISSGTATNPQDIDAVTLEIADAVTCVAVYTLSVMPKLALISQFPDGYNGPTANLTAVSLADSCSEAPSQRLGKDNVTVLQPGLARCNDDGLMEPGNYQLNQSAALGTIFQRWECFDITSGFVQGGTPGNNVVLTGAMSMTCVAVYSLPAPAPKLPKLALISQFPAGYNGPGANLTATITPGGQTTCIKLLSPQLNKNGTTLTAPGEGLCNTNGTMPPGTYNLDQRPPQGTEFDRWDCYDVSGTTPGQPDVDVDSVTLQEGDVITCVAVFTMRPKLALISEFPAGYSGPTANLTAKSISDSCIKAPSPRLDQNGTTVLQPGLGQCGRGRKYHMCCCLHPDSHPKPKPISFRAKSSARPPSGAA
ncbi:hypothetical protein OEZ86_002048 [Tetradesmus obliquus]|nr:hypothetical protein OEZ86_002048 [Tetradesmus obliquus]